MASAQETEPTEDRFLWKKGKSRSWDRVVVYDWEDDSLQIRKRDEVTKDQTRYTQFDLPKRTKSVSLYVDQKTKSKMVTDKDRDTQNAYMFLAHLHLNQLGLVNHALLLSGKLSTLFVTKLPSSDAESFTTSVHEKSHEQPPES